MSVSELQVELTSFFVFCFYSLRNVNSDHSDLEI